MSRLVGGWCAQCRDWPCKCRAPVNELSDGLEFRADDLTVLATRLFVALRDHLDPRHPRDCTSCGALVLEAEREFLRMGIPTP